MMTGSQNGILLGNSDSWRLETTARISNLSDGTNTFTVRLGFIDTDTGESTDGCFFRYTDGTNSGKWQGVCRNNNTESTCDTGITVAAATFYRLNVKVNAGPPAAGGNPGPPPAR